MFVNQGEVFRENIGIKLDGKHLIYKMAAHADTLIPNDKKPLLIPLDKVCRLHLLDHEDNLDSL